ncbi:MAG: hypothetical protein WCE30_20705 [Mycobacterium sp.]
MSSSHATRVVTMPLAAADFPTDYWDSFHIHSGAGSRPAREWARLCLRGAETANRAFSRIAWQGLLGFHLAARGTNGTLVGWRILVDTPTQFVLDADGSRMAGRMVFAVSDTDVEWTTMLHYHSTTGRLLWAIAGTAHRALAPACLNRAGDALLC